MSLFHDISLKLKAFRHDHFLLAVSGGLDSMALLSLFLWGREHLSWTFSVAHYHHGLTCDDQIDHFRNQAQAFVKNACEQNQVPFVTNKSCVVDPAQSEAHLRQLRYGFLREQQQVLGEAHLVLAHHRDDLLETRLLRLIRGTGAQGIEAMSEVGPSLLRPLLPYGREELREMVASQVGWIEDPSNQADGPLRNWLRNTWLPQLEEKREGAVRSLARSLELLFEELEEQKGPDLLVGPDIELNELWCMSEQQQRRFIALYMKSQGLKNYGLSHIKEVLKRLDTEKKSHTFWILGRCWKVDAGRMSVEPSA